MSRTPLDPVATSLFVLWVIVTFWIRAVAHDHYRRRKANGEKLEDSDESSFMEHIWKYLPREGRVGYLWFSVVCVLAVIVASVFSKR